MAAIRRKDTAAELKLRRALHALGLRYRIDWPLPFDKRRRADIWFGPARVAVFVDGCFWHGCPKHGTMPSSNREYWEQKISRNIERDRDTDSELRKIGWEPIRIWEHEDPGKAAVRIADTVRRRRRAPG